MILWSVLAMMTAAAIFAVLWPLARARTDKAPGSDVAVYQDQLAEIERDRAAGRIADAESEAARVEVSRRLLAAAEKATTQRSEPAGPAWRRRAATIAVVTLLPFCALGLYLALGSPQLPGEPLAAQLQEPPEHRSLAALVGQANGIVTEDAKASFERARALDDSDVRARFFIGVAAEQDGRRDEAAAIWRDLIAKAPAGAPWIDYVQHSLARLEGRAGPEPSEAGPSQAGPGPGEQDMAAAAELTPEQRSEMVRGMVA